MDGRSCLAALSGSSHEARRVAARGLDGESASRATIASPRSTSPRQREDHGLARVATLIGRSGFETIGQRAVRVGFEKTPRELDQAGVNANVTFEDDEPASHSKPIGPCTKTRAQARLKSGEAADSFAAPLCTGWQPIRPPSLSAR
jgi:hypothetical protein